MNANESLDWPRLVSQLAQMTSMTALAHRIGVDPKQVRRWIKGEFKPQGMYAEALLDEFASHHLNLELYKGAMTRKLWLAECKRYIIASKRAGLSPWRDSLVHWLRQRGVSDAAARVAGIQLAYPSDSDIEWVYEQQTRGLNEIAIILELAELYDLLLTEPHADQPEMPRPVDNGLADFISQGKDLSKLVTPDVAHCAFEGWVGNVTSWISRTLNDPAYLSDWASLGDSPLNPDDEDAVDFDERWKVFNDHLNARVRWLNLLDTRNEPKHNKSTFGQPMKPSRDVFIVHGRNEAVRESVARFIEKLNLKPVILHEQPNHGSVIIEKFERYSNVSFAIVLLTGG